MNVIGLAGRLPKSGSLWLAVVLVIFYAISSPAALAQATEMQTAEQYFSELQEALELTDEQVEKIEPIITEGRERQESILASYGIDLDSDEKPANLRRRTAMKMRGELKETREVMMEALSAVLTDEQLATYTEIQKDRAEEQRNAIRERIRGG